MQITIDQICKSYGGLTVLDRLSLTLDSGQANCLMGPSGTGKTTLLRIILGLEQPDSGTITGITPRSLTAVFQEDRLCEGFSPIDNILMVTGHTMTPGEVRAELSRLLPEESLIRPVRTLSGGMKRRVAIARALLAPSEGIIMDEPFTGLDEDTKRTVIAYLLEKTSSKFLLVSTHQEEDVELLNGIVIRLFSHTQNP